MSLLTIQPLGRNRDTPRLWLESQRLASLGFTHGIPLRIESSQESLVLRPAILGENHVSSRLTPGGGRRPIIDLASHSLLDGLSAYSEVKIIASFERIAVTPSHRAFAIARSRSLRPPFRVLDVFAGGGTLTAALTGNRNFQVMGGIEKEPDYADEWQARHPGAWLIQSDFRSLQPTDIPEFDVLIGGIPCTSHSLMGRAKRGLAERPELGEAGDLFLPVLNLIAARMPAAVLFENVPAFASSLAGELFATHLERLGYQISTTILQPNSEWNEVEDRKRWVLAGTLAKPFRITPPGLSCKSPVSAFLDPPDEARDRTDAARIARTIEGLRAHQERHRVLGHGFGFTVVDGTETRLPTLPKSYHKINTGPFVQTRYGPRLLRQSEIERIHGCELGTRHYATAVQMLGQGVQTRIFREIFCQLGDHLVGEA